MSNTSFDNILWAPNAGRIANANVTRFINDVSQVTGRIFAKFHDFYQFSISDPDEFWGHVFRFCEIRAKGPCKRVCAPGDEIYNSKWFPDVHLNFAENLLRYRDDQVAIVAWGEGQSRRLLTYRELHRQVAAVALNLKSWGVGEGDRVAGFMPNIPETIVAMLATASLGGIWSSCSPDFGVAGLLDRFEQIAPKVLFTADGYWFKDQPLVVLGKIQEALPKLPTVEHVVIIPYIGEGKLEFGAVHQFPELLHSRGDLDFAQVPFSHPLYIMFSSGTTGKPKCIVHSVGGTLIEHMKELVLHTDLKRSDRIFYQTTCGWMMWNWLVSSLAVGAGVVLFDGSPFHNEGTILWELAEAEQVTIFGTNAKYLAAIEKQGIKPRESHDIESIHTILSTGSPLLPESFDYVYRDVKDDVLLASISGGTDIIGCFALGCPVLPVHCGELQTRSLGLNVEVYDDDGNSIQSGKGELVCTAPFPSMPVGFWNDPDQVKYRAAYFERFPGVWHHGDYVELTKNNGLVMHGRSDTVLNPGGVRIGTSEIYRQVETLPEIEESIVIGQDWAGDVRVVLFVRLRSGFELNDSLKAKIIKQIRDNTSPFHVPKKILAVTDIPRTRSGKIVELAVKSAVQNQPLKNVEALANPEALELFKNLKELAS